MKQRKVPRGAASPAVVFALLLVLIASVVGAGLLLGDEAEQPTASTTPTGTTQTTPDHSLTDAEAIARFKELDALRIQALEERDLGILTEAFTRAGPIRRRLAKSIQQLQRQEVLVDEQWQLRDVTVLRNSGSSVMLRAVANSDARFFDEEGNDVTGSAIAERRTMQCLLKLEVNNWWLLHDCQIIKVVRLERP